MTPAISSGRASRLRAVSLARISSHSAAVMPRVAPTSPATVRTMSVRVLPAHTALTVMP